MIADTPNGRITYRGEIPPEIQAALEPLLEKYKVLFPDWLHHANVAYYTSPPQDSERAIMQTTSEPEYRTAYLDVFPGMMMYHDDKKCEFIAHEYIHITVNPLFNYAQKMFEELFKLDALKDNTALKAMILDQLRCVNESVTVDLQKIVCQLMEDREKPKTVIRDYKLAVSPLIGRIQTEDAMKKDSKKEESKESKKFEKAEEKSMKKPPVKKKGY